MDEQPNMVRLRHAISLVNGSLYAAGTEFRVVRRFQDTGGDWFYGVTLPGRADDDVAIPMVSVEHFEGAT